MLSPEEKQHLVWLTSEKYEGWGAIVELGAWLGSSTASLAEGLRRRGSTAKIQTFDRFTWESDMSLAAGEHLEDGADFQFRFHRETREYESWIDAHKVDLLHHAWEGGPIEILFVDSAKTWELANAVLRDFGPHLVPERSRVALQDFRHGYAYCLPLIFDSRPDIWKQAEDVEFGGTVTFVPLKPLFGPGGIDPAYSDGSFPLASADHLLRSRVEREAPHNRWRFQWAFYRRYLIDGPLTEVSRLKDVIVTSGIDEAELARLEDIGGILEVRGWAAYAAGDFTTARKLAERCASLPIAKTIHTPAILAFSSLRLEDRATAERAIEQVEQIDPGYPPAKLFRVELAIRDGLYSVAEADVLKLLRERRTDESAIDWALNLLTQAWKLRNSTELPLSVLRELAPFLKDSPSFAAHLARAQDSGSLSR